MSVEKAKEFLVDTTEDEEAAEKIQARYLESLVAVSKEMGYDLTAEDITIAIEEMSGLGESEEEVAAFITDSVFMAPSSLFELQVVTNPFRLGLPGGFGWRPRGR